MHSPLRFHYAPYPFWRHRVGRRLTPLWRLLLAANTDLRPPTNTEALVQFLMRWRLSPLSSGTLRQKLSAAPLNIDRLHTRPAQPYTGAPVRLPAQWEPMEQILIVFPVNYPPLWASHAALIAAVSAVCRATVLIPGVHWANAVSYYVETEARDVDPRRVRYLVLPTDDIWVRDFGPFVGLDADGAQVVVDARYDPLANYPQAQDDAVPARWAAHEELPLAMLDLHTEGGNLWSDGAGTLLMSDELLVRHPTLSRAQIEARLHTAFDFRKLIIIPRLLLEETGHVDLAVKLATRTTVLVAAPTNRLNRRRLRAAADLLRRETNADGEPYRVVELPMPPLYFNWGVFPVWRSYTNALTVNGRVLVPVYGVASDDAALAIYRDAMPDHEVIAIDCSAAANGGGAVHCLTKEIPAPGTASAP